MKRANMENTVAILDFPKQPLQILALSQTTPQKLADSAPYRAIIVFFLFGWGPTNFFP